MKYLFATQPNIWIHATLAAVAVLSGIVFQISLSEWGFLCFAIGFVFAAEVFNTAIEVLTDMISPGYNEKAKAAKDLAAAGVLFAATTALVTGLLVFGPRILELFQ